MMIIRSEKNKDKRQKKPLVKFGKRLKKRHYLIEFIFNHTRDEQLFQKHVELNHINDCFVAHFVKYWGEYGRTLLFQRPSFRVIYLNTQTHMCIIQIPHSVQQMFSSCLPFFTHVNTVNNVSENNHMIQTQVRVLHISGTIRALKQVAIMYHNKWMKDVQSHSSAITKKFEGQDFIAFDDDDDFMGMDDEVDGENNEEDDQVPEDAKYVSSTVQLLTMTSSDMQL